ncbi:MAG: HipA domain-containing protein [Firmicutes bacterium]|nr:HipA domain-containing protein [Bacillota bacterium]
MRKLMISIEINGVQVPVGTIEGTDPSDARFRYLDSYLSTGLPAISVSLPVRDEAYGATATKNFFEGLLPEGFARKTVSSWIHAPEDDYLTILQALGSECLGAIRVYENEEAEGSYEVLSLAEVKKLASEGILKSTELLADAHLSLTGASGKVGLYYDQINDRWLLPKGNAPSTHIVKQSHVRLSEIVTNEQLSLLTAAALDIEVPESFIINTGAAQDRQVLFATKRYDRRISDRSKLLDRYPCPLRLHQEDFAQAMGIAAKDKYETGTKNYLKAIFDTVRNNSANPIEDQLRLWDILIFDFLIGNTDNHIKNISLLYTEDLKQIRLAPAYDIVSTAIYKGSSRDMAIGIGGERSIDRITRSHFSEASADIGLGRRIAMARFDAMADRFEATLRSASQALIEQGFVAAGAISEKILKDSGYGRL